MQFRMFLILVAIVAMVIVADAWPGNKVKKEKEKDEGPSQARDKQIKPIRNSHPYKESDPWLNPSEMEASDPKLYRQ